MNVFVNFLCMLIRRQSMYQTMSVSNVSNNVSNSVSIYVSNNVSNILSNNVSNNVTNNVTNNVSNRCRSPGFSFKLLAELYTSTNVSQQELYSAVYKQKSCPGRE